jgi:putative ABC transport system substrate-binding protein
LDRRRFLLTSLAGALAAPLSGETQPAGKVHRIGFLSSGSSKAPSQFLEARGPNEFDGAFAAIAKGPAGALLVVADSLFILHGTRLAALAAKTRLPSLGQYREFVEAGGLMSYAPSFPRLGQRAATYVDRILKNAKPADLPVEQPTRLDLVINLKTAKALGLTIPPSLLARADEVVE